VDVLNKEKETLVQKRDQDLAAMVQKKLDAGEVSLKQDPNNFTIKRAGTLSDALTVADMAIIDLKAQLSVAKAALTTPESIRAFVEAQQSKVGRDMGDREYDELHSQLTQARLAASQFETIQGTNNPRTTAAKAMIDSLTKRIAAKEKSMAESQV